MVLFSGPGTRVNETYVSVIALRYLLTKQTRGKIYIILKRDPMIKGNNRVF